MPRIAGILETALYVNELDRATAFYRDLLGFGVMLKTERLVALDAGGRGTLLLFQRGATSDDLPTRGGIVPGHEGEGRLHLAFAIPGTEYEPWRERMARAEWPIISEVAWPAGGRSIYFKDPDQNVVELATPGLWPNYR